MSRAAQSHAQRSEHGEHGRSEPFTRRRQFHAGNAPDTLVSGPADNLYLTDVMQLTTVASEDYQGRQHVLDTTGWVFGSGKWTPPAKQNMGYTKNGFWP